MNYTSHKKLYNCIVQNDFLDSIYSVDVSITWNPG